MQARWPHNDSTEHSMQAKMLSRDKSQSDKRSWKCNFATTSKKLWHHNSISHSCKWQLGTFYWTSILFELNTSGTVPWCSQRFVLQLLPDYRLHALFQDLLSGSMQCLWWHLQWNHQNQLQAQPQLELRTPASAKVSRDRRVQFHR